MNKITDQNVQCDGFPAYFLKGSPSAKGWETLLQHFWYGTTMLHYQMFMLLLTADMHYVISTSFHNTDRQTDN